MKENRLFGLIGNNLSHSFSKKYFDRKFYHEKIVDADFKNFPLSSIEELKDLLLSYPSLKGLSVTIPFKQSVINLLDEIDDSAKKIGAVNCLKIERDENFKPKIKGYNTDVSGFEKSIMPHLKPIHKRALILGTGGASKSVFYVLNNLGIDCYFVSRDKRNSSEKNIFNYEDLEKNILNEFNLLVNTTPLGMFPNLETYPKIPFQYISSSHLLYDLIYNPSETEFLNRGKLNGATTVNGLAMLHFQANDAWEIWNKK